MATTKPPAHGRDHGSDNALDDARVVSGLGCALPEFARSMGVEIEPIAEAVGIPVEAFSDLDGDISLDRFCRLFEVLATISKDDAFGLKYATAYRAGSTGALGYALLSAPTLRDALKLGADFPSLVVDPPEFAVVIDQAEARLQWSLPPSVAQANQYTDFTVALQARVIRRCVGEDWKPIEVWLKRAPPSSTALYRKHFGAPVRFAAPMNVIRISLDVLDRPSPGADPVLFELMRRQCAEIAKAKAARRSTDLVARVRNEVLAGLADRRAVADLVARNMGMSERSLQRRLATRGLSFQQVVDETRRGLSDRLLAETDLSIAEIARRLGFAATSAYSRSALRWYGRSPSAERAQGTGAA